MVKRRESPWSLLLHKVLKGGIVARLVDEPAFVDFVEWWIKKAGTGVCSRKNGGIICRLWEDKKNRENHKRNCHALGWKKFCQSKEFKKLMETMMCDLKRRNASEE